MDSVFAWAQGTKGATACRCLSCGDEDAGGAYRIHVVPLAASNS